MADENFVFGEITHLLLENFKAFGREQRIPIRPITLIYGANNSGKSSIIQALLYAEHVHKGGELDAPQIVKDNHRVLQGGLARLSHGHNSPELIRFGWEWGNPDNITGLISGTIRQGLRTYSETLHSTLNGETFFSFTSADDPFFFARPAPENTAYQSALLNVQKLLARELRIIEKEERTSFQLRTLLGEICECLEKGRLAREIERQLFEDYHGLKMWEFAIPPKFRLHSKLDEDWEFNNPSPRPGMRATALLAGSLPSVEEYFEKCRGESDSRLSGGLEDDFESFVRGFVEQRAAYILFRWLDDVWAHFTEPLASMVSRVHYLGAVRTRPERIFFREPQDFANSKQAKRPQLEHPRDWVWQPGAIKQTNAWLRKHTKLVGNIELRYKEAPRRNGESGRKGAAPATAVPASVWVYDRSRKISLGFDEVGYGLSQFLPVLLACFAQQDSLGGNATGTLLVEEPEAHVHPALQSELGDVFIEAVTRQERPLSNIICETHSEHILLRIMRRIREGKLSPSNVAVLYVENPRGKESIVREMPLNQNGELIRDWPGGFFEEGLREVLL